MGAGLGGANWAKPHTPFLDPHIVIGVWGGGGGGMEGWGQWLRQPPYAAYRTLIIYE